MIAQPIEFQINLKHPPPRSAPPVPTLLLHRDPFMALGIMLRFTSRLTKDFQHQFGENINKL